MAWTKLTPANEEDLIDSLAPSLRYLMRSYGSTFVLAGGYVRRHYTNNFDGSPDIDLWLCGRGWSDKEMRKEIETEFKTSFGAEETEFAITAKNVMHKWRKLPTQLINKNGGGTPASLIDTFDWTITRAAVYWNHLLNDWESIIDSNFYEDVKHKHLRLGTWDVDKLNQWDSKFRIQRMWRYRNEGFLVKDRLAVMHSYDMAGEHATREQVDYLTETGKEMPEKVFGDVDQGQWRQMAYAGKY